MNMIEVAIPYSERGHSKSVVHDGMRFAQSIVRQRCTTILCARLTLDWAA